MCEEISKKQIIHPYLHKTLKDNGDIKVVGSNQRFKKTLSVT